MGTGGLFIKPATLEKVQHVANVVLVCHVRGNIAPQAVWSLKDETYNLTGYNCRNFCRDALKIMALLIVAEPTVLLEIATIQHNDWTLSGLMNHARNLLDPPAHQ